MTTTTTPNSRLDFLIKLAEEYGHKITEREAKMAHDIIISCIEDDDEFEPAYYAEAKSYFAN